MLTNGLDGGMSKILGDALESELALTDMKNRFRGSRPPPASAAPAFHPVLIGIARKSVLRYDAFSLSSSSPASPVVLENEGHAHHRHRRRFDGDASYTSCGTNDPKFELNPAHTHFILVRSEEKSSVSRVWSDVVEKEPGLRGSKSGRGRRKRTEMAKLHPMNLIENPNGIGDAGDKIPISFG